MATKLQGIFSLQPSLRPEGYFSLENVLFLENKISDMLYSEFGNRVTFPREDVLRIMARILEERYETIPKMNRRVIMTLTHSYRTYQEQRNKHFKWEENFIFGSSIHDPVSMRTSADLKLYKPPSRFGKPRVGGTTRFYFTQGL